MMGNRVSSTAPSQSQTPFTVISNKKSARADNITLSDPLRKVVKVMHKLSCDQDVLDDIRKENPAINIKRVTTWNNNFLDIGLHEITEVDSISIQNNVFTLFPYIISPTKCGYCQKWGHPTKNCQSVKPPVCHQCSLSHPRRNSPCVAQTKCSNCRGNHPTHDKVCSAYKKALQILAKISRRQENMKLETCTVSLPPPTLGAMLATFGQLTEFRVAFGGSRGTVTLNYGDKRRKRTRGKKPSAPGAAKGEPKPAAKLPAAVPSFVPPPAQPGASREVQGGPKLVAKPPVAGPSGNRSPPSSPTRTTRTGPRQVFPTHASTPRSSTTGSTLLPAAPVEPPVTMEVPVEQVAQKRKASSPLPSQTATRPVSPPSPRRWETARSRIRGRFREYISPPVEKIADLPREPATHV